MVCLAWHVIESGMFRKQLQYEFWVEDRRRETHTHTNLHTQHTHQPTEAPKCRIVHLPLESVSWFWTVVRQVCFSLLMCLADELTAASVIAEYFIQPAGQSCGLKS